MTRTTGRRAGFLGLLPLAAVLLLAGCESPPESGLPVVSMQVGTKSYKLEVAADEPSRTKGLMQRDTLAEGTGMIFVFPDEAMRGFWMKNTRIPLDIIFVNAGGTVVSTATMVPYSLKSTPSAAPAKYAIELNAGEVAKNGVKAGDRLEIPAGARETDN